MTPYHAKYDAHDLRRTGAEWVDRVTRVDFDAAIFKILNPN